MVDSKKDDGLDGKGVEIFLQTPLFRFKYVRDGQERELLENIVRVSGTVLRDKGAGLLVKVASIGSPKRTEKDPPFSELFIPYGKIDFIVVK